MSEANQALYDLFNGFIVLAIVLGFAFAVSDRGRAFADLASRRQWRGFRFERRAFLGFLFGFIGCWFVARISWMAIVCIAQGLIKFGLLELPRWGELRNTYTW